MKTIVIFSGAGLSKESGIPTFRDSLSGLWENFNIEQVASRGGWLEDPKTVLDFYAARWKNVQACEPNAAHKAIADLDRKFRVINILLRLPSGSNRSGPNR
ncbi:MAG: hypothetical protein LW850_10905 [Planctomycetaceae bacterium]|nr:hypothetical protein [Planctomycetaceae bacterium]